MVVRKSALAICILTIFAAGFGLAHSDYQCPPLWTHYQNNCYGYFGNISAWFYAEDHCQSFISPTNSSKTGHLVSIKNADENHFVFTLWNSSLVSGLDWNQWFGDFNFVNALWTGLNDYQRKPFDFVWSDGTPFNKSSYSNWAELEPDDKNGTEWCVIMWNTINSHLPADLRNYPDVWSDGSCNRPLSYICKLNLED